MHSVTGRSMKVEASLKRLSALKSKMLNMRLKERIENWIDCKCAGPDFCPKDSQLGGQATSELEDYLIQTKMSKEIFLSNIQNLKSRTCIWVSCGSTARLSRRRGREQPSSLILRYLHITLKWPKYFHFGLFVKYFPFFNLLFWAVSYFDICRLQWSSRIRWRRIWGTGVPGRRSGWTSLIFLGLLTRIAASRFLFYIWTTYKLQF